VKILFVTDPEADYGAALLYRGLCTALGESNVVDFPSKPTWHSPHTHKYTRGEVPFYPDHEGLTSWFDWMKLTPDLGYNADRVLSESATFDLTVLSSNRRGVWKAWDYLYHKAKFPRAVVTDHEDHNLLLTPSIVSNVLPIMFKREFFSVPVVRDGFKIFPLPFSCGWADLLEPGNPLDPQRSGVFLSCSITHPLRSIATAQINDFQQGGSVNRCQGDRYATGLRNALIGVSVRGHGVDTLRQWEVPFHGAALLTDSSLAMPNNFEHGVDCIRYTDHSQLGQIVKDLLAEPDMLRDVATKGQKKLLDYHTPKHRAEYFLARIKEVA